MCQFLCSVVFSLITCIDDYHGEVPVVVPTNVGQVQSTAIIIVICDLLACCFLCSFEPWLRGPCRQVWFFTCVGLMSY